MVERAKNKLDSAANHAALVLLSRATIVCLIPLSMWILSYFINVLDNVVELSHDINTRLAVMERVVDRLEHNHITIEGD